MNRQKTLRFVNPIMFLLLVYQGVTGFFRADMYSHFKFVHPVMGGLLLLLAGFHLFLNWPWVKNQYTGKKKIK